MAANVGNLNVKLTLSAEQFSAALIAAGGDVNQFAMRVDAAKTSTTALAVSTANAGTLARTSSGSVNRLGQAFTGAAYAAQDFASQLGTRGVGGGLTAIANNIPMMAAALPGWGQAVGLAASVAVQGFGIYLESAERARKKTEELKKEAESAFGLLNYMQNQFERSVQAGRSAVTDEFRMRGLRGASAEALQAEITSNTQRAEEGSAERRLIEQRQKQLFALFTGLKPGTAYFQGELATAQESILVGGVAGMSKEQEEEFRKNQMRIQALKDEERRAAENNLKLDKMLEEAKRKELDDRKKDTRESLAARYMTAEERRKQDEAALRDALQSGAINQGEFDEYIKRMSGISRQTSPFDRQPSAAPGIGAFGADTQQGFSMIQAALRTAKDVKNPQLDTIGTNTRKTADNTRDIAKNLRRIKVATIA